MAAESVKKGEFITKIKRRYLNAVYYNESNISGGSKWIDHDLNYVPFYLAACSDQNINGTISSVKSYMFPKIKPSGSYPYDVVEDGRTDNDSGINSATTSIKFITGQNSVKSYYFSPDTEYG